jgi:hypothetical protein
MTYHGNYFDYKNINNNLMLLLCCFYAHFLLITWKNYLCVGGWFQMKSFYVSQAGLELTVLLPLSLEFWNYKHMLRYPALLFLLKISVSCVFVGKR